MSRVQSKIMGHTKNMENMTQSEGKRQSTEANPEVTQMLKLSDKDFKGAIITCSVNEKIVKISTEK